MDSVVLNLKESSLNSTIKAYDGGYGSIKVEAITLDSLASYEGGIDFVKVDIEGAEQLAWKGMQHLFSVNKNCVVMMEFVPPHYEENGRLFFNDISNVCNISCIDYHGEEVIIPDYHFFETWTEEFLMLILRKR
jgi:hypothetical protein